MTYVVDGVGKIVWEVSKSLWDDDMCENLFPYMKRKISEYSGVDVDHISDSEVVTICIGTFAKYTATGLAPSYEIERFLGNLSGISLKFLFGKDSRDSAQKMVEEILIFLRYQQIRLNDGSVLVDYGQI